jgi:hypothetical protein
VDFGAAEKRERERERKKKKKKNREKSSPLHLSSFVKTFGL